MPINRNHLRFRGCNIEAAQDRQLRFIAAERDISISAVMREALDGYLAKQPVTV